MQFLCHGAHGDLADQAHDGQQGDGAEAHGHPQAALFQPLLGQVQIGQAGDGANNGHKGGKALQEADAGGGAEQVNQEQKYIANDHAGHNKIKLTVTVGTLCHEKPLRIQIYIRIISHPVRKCNPF